MKSIIEELYYDGFYSKAKVGEEYKNISKEVLRIEQILLESFPDCRQLHEQFSERQAAISSLEYYNQFLLGFKTGAKIILELLTTE